MVRRSEEWFLEYLYINLIESAEIRAEGWERLADGMVLDPDCETRSPARGAPAACCAVARSQFV